MDLALATAAVASTAPVVDRTLPVGDPWRPMLPHGLVRGRTVSCTGLAAPSLGLSILSGALTDGAWLVLVDLPWLGIEAARELGAPPERIVRVDPTRADDVADGGRGDDGRGELWVETIAAAIDGFDCILTRVPRRVPTRLVERLSVRLRRRGGVLVTVGDPGSLTPDLVVTARDPRWDGLGDGHGHLLRRRLAVTISGRRMPRSRRADLHLPSVAAIGPVPPEAATPPTGPTTPAPLVETARGAVHPPAGSRDRPERPLRPAG